MRRASLAAAAIALLVGTALLASGCAKGAATVGTSVNAAASANPSPWAKVVELGGSLNGARRGRDSVTVDLTGSALRFDVTYGPAPGWGADHARLRWWLYPETNGPIAPAPVPLRVVSEAHQATDGSVTLRLESSKPLTPNKYDFFYQGSGWYGMAVFER